VVKFCRLGVGERMRKALKDRQINNKGLQRNEVRPRWGVNGIIFGDPTSEGEFVEKHRMG